MNSISGAAIPVTPTLVSVATISKFRAVGNDIFASTRLLVQEDFEPHSDKCMNKDNSVELDNAFFMWEDASISEMGAKAKAAMEANNKAKNRKAS